MSLESQVFSLLSSESSIYFDTKSNPHFCGHRSNGGQENGVILLRDLKTSLGKKNSFNFVSLAVSQEHRAKYFYGVFFSYISQLETLT